MQIICRQLQQESDFNSLLAEKMLDFKYLGTTLIPNGQAKDEIITRIMTARNAFFQLIKSLCSCREITEARIYLDAIRSILLYS